MNRLTLCTNAYTHTCVLDDGLSIGASGWGGDGAAGAACTRDVIRDNQIDLRRLLLLNRVQIVVLTAVRAQQQSAGTHHFHQLRLL